MASMYSHAKNIYKNVKSRLKDKLGIVTKAVRKFIRVHDASDQLLITDDIFPHMLSAFRIAEYNAYLKNFPNARVYSTTTAFSIIKEKRSLAEVVREYEKHYPQYKGRVLKHKPRLRMQPDLIYTIFINNAFNHIHLAEEYNIPFVFTLYPGGGFRLWNPDTNSKLNRVFTSSSFRKVIVTQKISYEYLLNQKLCIPEQIEFIYGGVLSSNALANNGQPKKKFGETKKTFDICFVAYKYMPMGADKGYDVFVEVAKLLSKVCKEIVFHVVGPFNEHDIDVSHIKDKIKFYGTIHTDSFPHFYANMDIILSPNKPFVLNSGGFDGFPTGACVEAGLCGVAVMCTDALKQNIKFEDNKEILIIEQNVQEICDQILNLYNKPEELYQISSQGQKAFQKVFDLNTQMQPRLNILSALLEKERIA